MIHPHPMSTRSNSKNKIDTPRPVIVCDLGGVLIHLTVERCIAQFRELMGQQNMQSVLGIGDDGEGIKAVSAARRQLMADFERGHITSEQFVDSVRQFCKPGTTPRQIIDAWMAMLGELPQQRLDFLASLKQQGYPLFLLSNGNELHFNYINDTYHLDRYFDELFLSQRLHMAKPAPDIFLHVHRAICQRYMPLTTHPDFTPHVIFIDDLPANRQSATDTVHWTSVSALTDLCQFVPISGNDSI